MLKNHYKEEVLYLELNHEDNNSNQKIYTNNVQHIHQQ